MKNFTMISNLLIQNRKFERFPKLLYILLRSYCYSKDFCFPGQKRLADDLGVSEEYIRRNLKLLEQEKIIIIFPNFEGRGNLYYVDPIIVENPNSSCGVTGSTVPVKGPTIVPPNNIKGIRKLNNTEINELKNNISNLAKSKSIKPP